MPAFLRGLWGDELSGSLLAVYLDIKRQSEWPQPEPLVVACFGEANAQFVRRRGYEVELLDRSPVANFTGAKQRNPDVKGWVNYGQSHWRHKLEAIRWGVLTFGAVVWLDWDVELAAPMLHDFWEELNTGQPVRASLQQYHRPVADWRTEDQRKLPSGSFIYCRDAAQIDWMTRLSVLEPLATDGELLARWHEEREGGWKGPEAYRAGGYHPFCHDLGGRGVFPAFRALFVAHRSAQHDENIKRIRAERRRSSAQDA